MFEDEHPLTALALKEIGYLRITSFTEQSTAGVQDAVEKIKKEAGNKLKGFVLDLAPTN